MSPAIEFICGAVVNNVGAIGLTCLHHVGKCNNPDCQAEVIAEAEKAGLL